MTYLAERAGHREQPEDWRPTRRATQLRSLPPAGCSDPAGMDRYVDECATRHWKPEGSALRRCITSTRGLPRDVLLRNCVGPDPGPRIQRRPDALPPPAGVSPPTPAAPTAVPDHT